MNRNGIGLLIQKGWPFVLPMILFGLPPIASKGYALQDFGTVNAYILTHPLKFALQPLYPIFRVLPIVLSVSLLLLGNKSAKLFALSAAVSYALFGLLQGISLGEEFGLGIQLSHLALSLLIAMAWLREARTPANDYSRRERPPWKYWVILPALLAFWAPANPATATMDFHPAQFLFSGAGLAFCMMTPFYLAVLILCHPRVNPVILTLTGVVGLLYAVGNIWLSFVSRPGWDWWIGVLHAPLLFLSLYGLILSIRDAFLPPRFFGTGKSGCMGVENRRDQSKPAAD